MPRTRKNKTQRTVDKALMEPWFRANKKRQRARAKAAKLSRKKNRGK